MAITLHDKKQYVDEGGGNCPKCGSNDLHGQELEADAGIVWQNIDCHGCGTSWTDVYTLTGIDNVVQGKKA